VKYEELLADIASKNYRESRTLDTPYAALNAVVELHKPYPSKPHKPDGVLYCQECTDYSTANWPCSTIKAIEKELV
jgi:hypothetical protein